MRQAAETGRDAYEFITEAAAEVAPGCEGLLFLPYLTGERTPHKDPCAKGVFLGLSLRHTKAYMARAIMEGVAYGMRDSLEIIRGMRIPVKEVRASGGGARSALWRQILADTGRAPMVAINASEGPSYGAAILASVAAGFHDSVEEACGAIIHETDRVLPVEARAKVYDGWFKEYQEAYRALAPAFKRMAAML